MKRKICVITGSRAEYGLLRVLLEAIKADADLRLQLLVTGMHLSAEFGLTFKEIEADGFTIDEKIDVLLDSDSPAAISKSMGLGMIGFGDAYARLRPDIVVVLGDRFELLGPVSAALVSGIAVAHIHGGEVTEAAYDDSIRHCITKMSHLHFTATQRYRRRVIQLGEQPGMVFNVGAIGLDSIKRLKLLSKNQLEKRLNLRFNKRNLLVTFHPVTLEGSSTQQFQQLLDVLDGLEETSIIFTKANADTGGRVINRMIDDYVSGNSNSSVAFSSMGRLNYLSAMQFVDAVVGNSSSGIIEAPSFKIPTVNIGDRQAGRIRAKSVIDCRALRKDIGLALKKACSAAFKGRLKGMKNPYGDGSASKRIKDVLKKTGLKGIIKKGFYDVDFRFRR